MTFDARTHVHSVKEISLFAECLRKGACKYLHGVADPKHPNAQDGIDMHALLQAMVERGPSANVNPESKVGTWARKLYALTPANCHTEVGQGFELFGRRASFKIDFVPPGFAGVGDWKGVSDPKWALAPPGASAEDQQRALANDLQANLEANGFMKVFGRQSIPLCWLYVDKKTNQTWSVMGVLTFEQTETWLAANALPHMLVIEALRGATPRPHVHAIPHELTACGGKAKGCNFLGACQFMPSTVGLTTERLYQLAGTTRPAPVAHG